MICIGRLCPLPAGTSPAPTKTDWLVFFPVSECRVSVWCFYTRASRWGWSSALPGRRTGSIRPRYPGLLLAERSDGKAFQRSSSCGGPTTDDE